MYFYPNFLVFNPDFVLFYPDFRVSYSNCVLSIRICWFSICTFIRICQFHHLDFLCFIRTRQFLIGLCTFIRILCFRIKYFSFFCPHFCLPFVLIFPALLLSLLYPDLAFLCPNIPFPLLSGSWNLFFVPQPRLSATYFHLSVPCLGTQNSTRFFHYLL